MLSTSVQIHHQFFARKCSIFLKMEIQVTPEIKSRPFKTWLLIGLLPVWFIAVSYGAYRLYKEMTTMPPPLVFLIPADYFGPVFFFFDQPDGVDVQPDPLGNAVNVPENGVVKIKARISEVMGNSKEGYRATYVVSIDKAGKRKILKLTVGAQQDESNGSKFTGYIDESLKLQKFPYDSETLKVPGYYLFPKETWDERMIFRQDSCKHQNFTNVPMPGPGEPPVRKNDPSPVCGKLLVITPNEFDKLPKWMWQEAQREFDSIESFVEEANERVKMKKEYYKLP
jgi:hypothetical protein